MMTPVRKNVTIRPVELYGNAALPCPRFFDDHQFKGGPNFTRLRLEGNVDKLPTKLESSSPGDSEKKKRSGCDYPPPAAPVAVKQRRYVDLNDGDEEGFGLEDEGVARIIRNLSDDFDRVAGESKIIKKSPGKRLKKEKKKKKKTLKVEETSSNRITSPKLTKSQCFRF